MLATNRFMYEKKRAQSPYSRMYHAANTWMKKPTPVMTPSMVSDKPSRRSAKRGAKPPTSSHCHSGWVNAPPAGGCAKNSMPTASVVSADTPMAPIPIAAAALSDRRLRPKVRMTKPENGARKTRKSRLNMARVSLSSHWQRRYRACGSGGGAAAASRGPRWSRRQRGSAP